MKIDEQERQRQILQNQALLEQLGISSTLAASRSGSRSSIFACSSALTAGPSSNAHHRRSSTSLSHLPDVAPRKRARFAKHSSLVRKYDRSGHILSLPLPGERHVISCIEFPADRKLSKRIAEGEYEDCMHWAEGEERRWRFGFGVSWSGVDGRGKGKGKGMELEEGEEEEVGGVGKEFRWRRWQGLERELRREMEVLEGRAEGDQDGEEEVAEVDGRGAKAAGEGVSAYSVGLSTY